MKQIIILIALTFYVTMATAQRVMDENAIPNEYITQFHDGQSAADFFSSYPNTLSKQCLSKQMNIWLIKTDIPGFNFQLMFSRFVKISQYNHHNITHRALVPNDSLFNLQWNMLNTSYPGADISATQAWQLNHSNLTQAGDSIVIAVIDGGYGYGFDIYHPDINFFVNHHEIPNNGIDDDGNGYIDDYLGWNVFGSNDSVYSNADPHGTHVSGIAGAIGNNTIGVAGVCWGAKILAVNGASNTESDVIMAYDYVIAMRRLYDQTGGAKGAFIVATNSSFGIDGGLASQYPIWCAMYDSMGAYGILSATATTNNPWNVDNMGDMPTTCPSKWLIAVTNTTRNDVLNSQAGYGPINIDIGAPGTSIMSCFENSNYGYDAGTSMASPHVAGAVAALYANACPKLLQDYFTYPDSFALLMKSYLLHAVDPLSTLENVTVSGGRLNLYHAYITEDGYNCNSCNYTAILSQQNLSCYGDSSGSITVSTSGGSLSYHYLWSNGDATGSVSNLKAGFYQVTVTDSSGCQRQLSTLIAAPQPIVISSITVLSIGPGSGNIIVGASAGNDTLTYAIDSGSYQTGAIFVTNVAGIHIIHIRNQTGCVVDTAVGIYGTCIGNINANPSIIVSPNPSTGSFYFSGLTGMETIQVYDMLGRNVNVDVAENKDSYTINLSGKSKGVYIYKVVCRDNEIQQGKLVLE